MWNILLCQFTFLQTCKLSYKYISLSIPNHQQLDVPTLLIRSQELQKGRKSPLPGNQSIHILMNKSKDTAKFITKFNSQLLSGKLWLVYIIAVVVPYENEGVLIIIYYIRNCEDYLFISYKKKCKRGYWWGFLTWAWP